MFFAQNFTNASQDTEILNGITFGVVELKLKQFLIESVKAANPAFQEYNIDLEKALGI